MGVHTEHHKLHLPQKRQLLILLPFAMFYTVAAMLGQLEKAESLGIVHNLGRAGGWFLGSYAVLVVLCMAISQRDAIMQYIPFLRGLPEQKERDGKWYLYLLFTGICLLCYLPYYLMYYPGWLSNGGSIYFTAYSPYKQSGRKSQDGNLPIRDWICSRNHFCDWSDPDYKCVGRNPECMD